MGVGSPSIMSQHTGRRILQPWELRDMEKEVLAGSHMRRNKEDLGISPRWLMGHGLQPPTSAPLPPSQSQAPTSNREVDDGVGWH